LCYNGVRMAENSWEEYTDQNAEWFKKTFTHWCKLPKKPKPEVKYTEELFFPKNPRIAFGFLHSHPMEEQQLGLGKNHVIVDKKDWLQVRNSNVKFKEKNTEVRTELELCPYLPETFCVEEACFTCPNNHKSADKVIVEILMKYAKPFKGCNKKVDLHEEDFSKVVDEIMEFFIKKIIKNKHENN